MDRARQGWPDGWRAIDESPDRGPSGDEPTDEDDEGLPAAPPRAPARTSWRWIAPTLLVAGAVLAGLVVVVLGTPEPSLDVDAWDAGVATAVERLALPPAAAPETSASTPIVVDVGGAVRRPGVYRLAAGSRVADAIDAAGGVAAGVDAAAATALNLAAPLSDGVKVVVPVRGAPSASVSPGAAGPEGGDRTGTETDRVDLNQASQSELEALPGIGPATARKILDARAERPFASLDELRERKVLGQATLERIRDLVTTGP